MGGLYNFDSINDYNSFNNHETLHPLVSVIDFSKAHERNWDGHRRVKLSFGLYCIFLKDVKCGDLRYGRNYYDYQEGTLVFTSPGQVTNLELTGEMYQPMGYGLFFHPDLLNGTTLAEVIKNYNFFSYATNEALHISERERSIVMDCFEKINYELQQGVDKHSKKVICSNIELFLNYCDRFYDRQFITREDSNQGVIEKFDKLLNRYFTSDMPKSIGLPSVAYFADELHLSANYFGDLIKKETGKSAKDHIQDKVLEAAKNLLYDQDKSISEIAYELGFKYPQHFTRYFKNIMDCTPNEFRLYQ